eukprot:symbB.v1.2.019833.t1/scaffold1644.1/size164340/3
MCWMARTGAAGDLLQFEDGACKDVCALTTVRLPMLDSMDDFNHRADLIPINTALNACAKECQVDLALGISSFIATAENLPTLPKVSSQRICRPNCMI